MPAGRYTVMDAQGHPVGVEEFRCAPGPAGWRYFSTVETTLPEPHRELVDLVVDGDWRPVRVRIDTGAHDLLLTREGDRLSGSRDGEPLEVPFGSGLELDYLSPAFNAVTANRRGATAEFDVVYLQPFTCEPVRERQRYESGPEEEVDTPVGRFSARRWGFTALSSGWARAFWVAGDVVVRFEHLFELAEYEPGASGPRPLA